MSADERKEKLASRIERLRAIMTDYQEDHELDRDNPWYKEVEAKREAFEKTLDDIYEAVREYSISSQNLGFVQGVQFAMDVIDMKSPLTESDDLDNRHKILNDFIQIMSEN